MAAALLITHRAAAIPDFPGILYDTFDMPCVPQCVLCHTTAVGQRGTANNLFATSVVRAGFDSSATDKVASAKAAVRIIASDKPCSAVGDSGLPGCLFDADNDGTNDATELRNGADPNANGDGHLCVRYGCGAHIARRARNDSFAAVTAALVALALAVRGRRRRRRR